MSIHEYSTSRDIHAQRKRQQVLLACWSRRPSALARAGRVVAPSVCAAHVNRVGQTDIPVVSNALFNTSVRVVKHNRECECGNECDGVYWWAEKIEQDGYRCEWI
jgi:hypothetical protein